MTNLELYYITEMRDQINKVVIIIDTYGARVKNTIERINVTINNTLVQSTYKQLPICISLYYSGFIFIVTVCFIEEDFKVDC